MNFSVYLPPQAESGRVPVLYWLSGLTCTDENFLTKAGAQRDAAELGIMLVMPDTSPRGAGVEGEDDSWDFGTGAGFYVDAAQPKWAKNYNMYSYVTQVRPPTIRSVPLGLLTRALPGSQELVDLVNASFPTLPDRASIFGHSMGGHGALVCFLRNPVRHAARRVRSLVRAVRPARPDLGRSWRAGQVPQRQRLCADLQPVAVPVGRQGFLGLPRRGPCSVGSERRNAAGSLLRRPARGGARRPGAPPRRVRAPP